MADGGVRPEDIEWNIDSLGATLVELYNNMSELIDMYEELRDRVYAVETTGGGSTSEPSKYCWRNISDPAEATRLWNELRSWVDWLNFRYFSTGRFRIAPCWYRHGAAVEELTALWASWKAAYQGGDFSDSAFYWHERLFDSSIERLKGYFRECQQGHRQMQELVYITDDGFDDFVSFQVGGINGGSGHNRC